MANTPDRTTERGQAQRKGVELPAALRRNAELAGGRLNGRVQKEKYIVTVGKN
jgi:hypothetical protein